MLKQRRTNDRRRRVVYSAQNADTAKPTAASRRAKEKLREARHPTKAYGERVQRRLRGRWFSLVPVKLRSLLIGASIIACVSLLLTYAHYAAVTWPWLAYKPEIARPLRLDQPDSFGRWIITMLLVASAAVSLLIYQLRRYRNDDFRGEYRLWRTVLLVMIFASVNSLVSFVHWSGALLDLAFGKRIAFSGYDWVRIVLGLGGIVLALRMVVEVRRSRWALVGVLTACGFLALPEAVKWKLIEVDSIGRWTLVTAAPLLGYTALFLSFVGYLRLLYREVRNISDSDTIGQRLQGFRDKLFTRAEVDDEEFATDQQPTKRKKSRRQSKRAERRYAESESEDTYEEGERYDEDTYEEEEVVSQDEESATEYSVNEEDFAPRKKKRRWFGLRAAKPERDDTEVESTDELVEDEPEKQEQPRSRRKKKKRRFGLRLDPTELQTEAVAEPEPAAQEVAEPEAEVEEESRTKKKKFGLSGWRKKQATQEEPTDEEEPEFEEIAEQQQSVEEEPEVDPDDIDWSSMSKSERRRLRKKLKRQGKAA